MTEPEQTDIEQVIQPSRTRGRTRRQANAATQEPARGAREVRGRNGEVLSRRRVAGIDQFAIPDELIPAGWTYQWNTVTVYNNADLVVGQTMQMYENGWRPVPAERHPGRFVPMGKTGDIIRDGMRLEERPKSMTEEAKAEDIAVARRQMTDRDQSLMGGKANVRGNMGQGFEMNRGKYRGTGADLRISIDPGLEAPTPSHPLAEPGE